MILAIQRASSQRGYATVVVVVVDGGGCDDVGDVICVESGRVVWCVRICHTRDDPLLDR